MQTINSITPAATTALDQPSSGNNNPMGAGSDLIAKMFQNQGGIGGDLMKMLMNPSSLQNLQGDAALDSDSVESTGDDTSAASESSSASDQSAAGESGDTGALLEKLMEDLTALINLVKNQNSDGKQMQQGQGQGQANSPAAGGQSGSAGTPQANGAQGQAGMGSSSSSQSQSSSVNGNTTTTNTKDGKTTTTSTNNQGNAVRADNVDTTNNTPGIITAGSLNQASLDRQAKTVNDSFAGTNMTAKPEAFATSLDGSTPPAAGTQPANSFKLNGTVNDGKPAGTADLKLGDVNIKASLDDASELSVGADAKLTPSTTATLSGDKGGVDAGVKFDDGKTNIGAKVNNIGGPDTNAQIDAGTKIGDNGFVQGSYNTNGAASFGIGLNF
jgi:hypothetical protein